MNKETEHYIEHEVQLRLHNEQFKLHDNKYEYIFNKIDKRFDKLESDFKADFRWLRGLIISSVVIPIILHKFNLI